MRQDDHPAHGRRVRAADRGRDLPREHAGGRRAAVQAPGQHRVPELRPLPPPVHVGERRLRTQAQGRREERDAEARRRGHRDGRDGVHEGPQAGAALGRSAAARRAGARAGQPPDRAPARRAARRSRREVAQGHAARAQEAAERRRHHVHLRDPRPGRGAHHERPPRRDEPGSRRADRHPHGHLREPRVGLRRQLHRRVQHLPVGRDQGRQRRRRVPHRQGPRRARVDPQQGHQGGRQGRRRDPPREVRHRAGREGRRRRRPRERLRRHHQGGRLHRLRDAVHRRHRGKAPGADPLPEPVPHRSRGVGRRREGQGGLLEGQRLADHRRREGHGREGPHGRGREAHLRPAAREVPRAARAPVALAPPVQDLCGAPNGPRDRGRDP